MKRPLLDVPALAVYLSVTQRHVYRLVHERRLPHHKLGPGRNAPLRFRPEEIDAWLEQFALEVAS